MRRIYKIASMLLISAFFAVSCLNGDGVIYNDQTVADVVNGELITDAELHYNVIEDETDGKWVSEERVYLFSDILEETTKGHYNIRLRQYLTVEQLHPVKLSQIDDRVVGRDTTLVQSIWRGRQDRLNVLFAYPCKEKEDKSTFTMVYDDNQSTTDKMVFIMRRNSHGDHISSKDIVLGASGVQYRQAVITSTYSEFLLRPDQNAQIVILNGSNADGRELGK